MRPTVSAALAASALVALALGVSDACLGQDVIAYAEGRPDLDYDAFWKYTAKDANPGFRSLGTESLALARQLNDCMLHLAEGEKEGGASKGAREEAREILTKYRDNKAAYIRMLDECLKTPPPKEDDLVILKKLRDTELEGVVWDKTYYINCLRDIASALRLRVVLHPDVLKFNTVEARFPRTSADGILRGITTGFGAEAVVYNGEVIVIKTIKRNDERLQKYLTAHPEWKYWEIEKAQDVEDDL
jgi:hypothetical protein